MADLTNLTTSFAIVSKVNLTKVPFKEGQVIFIKDEGQILYDLDGTRKDVTSFITSVDISVPGTTGIVGKLYLNKNDNNLYIWDATSTSFVKIINKTASEISFDKADTSIVATNVQAALVEISNLIADKVSNVDSEGNPVSVISNTSLTAVEDTDNGKGIHLSKTTLNLKDGSTVTTGSTIYVNKDLGLVDSTDLETLKTEINTAIAAKLDSANANKNIVADIDIQPNDVAGFKYEITLVNLSTGEQIPAVNGTLTAADMMVATEEEVTQIKAEINALKNKGVLMYALDFATAFPTATDGQLTKELADAYLETLGQVPSVGTAFLNTNKEQPTANFVFTYYIDETVEPTVDPETSEKTYTLKLIADGPDKINIATSETIGGIKAGATGDINVDASGNVTIKNQSITSEKLAEAVANEIADKLDKTFGEVVTGLTIDVNTQGNYPVISVTPKLKDTETGTESDGEVISVNLDALSANFDAKVDKVKNGTAGHIVTLSADGGIVDSGKTLDEIGSGEPVVEGAVKGNVASFGDGGKVIDSGIALDTLGAPKWINYDETVGEA